MLYAHQIGKNKYGEYCVPDSSRHRIAAQTILRGGVYEPQTIDFIRANCGEGSVIHAGTYFGDFIPAISKSLARETTLFCFEPNPESFACAEETIRLNQIHNARIQNLCLGFSQAVLQLQITLDGQMAGGASKVVRNPPQNESVIDVNCASLDDIVPSVNISVLHLDVEGYEANAIRGGLKTIAASRPSIILETKLSGDDELMLTQFGYKIAGRLDHNYLYLRN